MLVVEAGSPRLVLGSAGSVRLAGAIAQVTWRILQGEPVATAIEAPRLHVDGATLHLEGGWSDDVVGLPPAWDVVRWDGLNLFFGGVQAVALAADGGPTSATRAGAARAWSSGDPGVRRAEPTDAPALRRLSPRPSRGRRGAGS